MSMANTANLVKNWTVMDLTDSDHRVISFELALNKPAKRAKMEIRYDVKSADWDLFRTTLLGEVGRIPVSCTNTTAECITRAITTAADRSIPRMRRAGAVGRNPW